MAKSAGVLADDLMAIVGTVMTQTAGFAKEFENLGDQGQAAYKAEEEALLKQGGTNAELATLDEQTKVNRQGIMQARARALGTAADSKELEILGTQLVQAQGDALSGAKDLAERAAVTVDQDLFGWLGYQVARPFLEDEQAKREAVATQLATSMQNRLALTSQMAASTKAIDEGTSAARVAIVGQAKINEAAVLVAQARERAVAAGINNISLRSAHNMKQVDLVNTQFSSAVRLQELQLSQARDARDAERLTLQKETQQWQREVREEKVRDEQLFLERANTVQRALGLNEYENIAAVYKQPKAAQEQLFKAMESVDLTKGSLGQDPLSAARLLQSKGIVPPENMKEGIQLARAVEQTLMEQHDKSPAVLQGGAKFRQLPKDAQEAMVQEAIQKRLAESRQVINPVDTGNIYNPLPFKKLLEIPVLANNPIMQKMIPFATDERYMLRPQDMLEAAKAAGLSGTAASVQVAQLYKTIMNATAQDKQFLRLGIPVAKSYPVQMEMPGVWAAPMKVDWTSSTSIDNYRLRQANAKGIYEGTPDLATGAEFATMRGEAEEGPGLRKPNFTRNRQQEAK